MGLIDSFNAAIKQEPMEEELKKPLVWPSDKLKHVESKFNPSCISHLVKKENKTREEWFYLHEIGICYHDIFQCQICQEEKEGINGTGSQSTGL